MRNIKIKFLFLGGLLLILGNTPILAKQGSLGHGIGSQGKGQGQIHGKGKGVGKCGEGRFHGKGKNLKKQERKHKVKGNKGSEKDVLWKKNLKKL